MDKISLFCADFARSFPDSPLLADEPMRRHTTFKIGGPVRAFVEPKSEDAFAYAVGACRERAIPFLILGNGSNLLVSDDAHELVCVSTAGMNAIDVEDETVTAGAGALLSQIAHTALDAGLAGFEFAHGIPGSLGGAVYMNAGAYGGEMKDVIERVRYLTEDGAIREISGDECGFAYRKSRFEEGGIVLSAAIRLTPGDPAEIRAKMDDLARRRREKQPLNYPSAGSTFKRPAAGYAAALIDEAGLKGARVGDAEVSDKHAGFVVNRGGASFEDVTRLMELIQKTVLEKSGVQLEPEVKIIR